MPKRKDPHTVHLNQIVNDLRRKADSRLAVLASEAMFFMDGRLVESCDVAMLYDDYSADLYEVKGSLQFTKARSQIDSSQRVLSERLGFDVNERYMIVYHNGKTEYHRI